MPSEDPTDIEMFYYNAYDYVDKAGYGHEVQWCRDVKFQNQTAMTFMQEYTRVVINAAFKEQYARKIYNEFWSPDNFNTDHVFDIIKHPNKRKAIIKVSSDYTNIFENLKNADDKLAYIRTLPYMGGDALGYHLARNLGLDFCKPDRHMNRLAERFGYKTPTEMCLDIQKKLPLPERIGVIDVILWRYCNLTGGV